MLHKLYYNNFKIRITINWVHLLSINFNNIEIPTTYVHYLKKITGYCYNLQVYNVGIIIIFIL